ncbi:murein transglycosylase A [Pseudoruegeria aquimaris]|nr:murein transglycosylase A [Pseudoruegeria aquimaris]
MTPLVQAEGVDYTLLSFEDLHGWAEDDHEQALEAFLETCGDLKDPAWAPLCEVARTRPGARSFFELFFRPVMMRDGNPPLFTGYFEPELDGSLTPSDRFRYPLYRTPPEARAGPFVSRREIEEQQLLAGRGLEIAWVDDPVELFFLQIQGSGRIRLPDGQVLRVGYGGNNGHSYRSIGQELVRRGIYGAHQVSAQVIRNWVRRNPALGRELLWHNPSYVFFRKIRNVSAEKGPLGAMNRSITSGRTVAVDPAFTPLGAPVWVEKAGRDPFNRLMIAQDTGSAIKGAQRADIFYGTGDEAGRIAGQVKDPGRMVVLLPIQTAFELVPEGEG